MWASERADRMGEVEFTFHSHLGNGNMQFIENNLINIHKGRITYTTN